MDEKMLQHIMDRSVFVESGCIEWALYRDRDGYGQATVGGKKYAAHRLSYAAANGPIPDGINVCHSCDNPPCVNPDHLFAGTTRDNVLDKMAKGRLRGAMDYERAKTHCPQGHPYDEANTYVYEGRGKRQRGCRSCNRTAVARYKARRAAA